MIIDVSEQKQAQRALEESEQRLTSILNSMQDVVWSVRAKRARTAVCQPGDRDADRAIRAEAFHANHELLIETVHPERPRAVRRTVGDMLNDERIDTDYRITQRDGSLRWVHNRFWLVRDSLDNPRASTAL